MSCYELMPAHERDAMPFPTFAREQLPGLLIAPHATKGSWLSRYKWL